jgi:uncharacterized protein YbaR (Trm112 family)/SAM-dependent methyltransferase
MSLFSPIALYYKTRTKWTKLRNHLRPRRAWRVLDIGSGNGPTPSADVLCDRFVGDDAERVAPICLDRPFVSGDVEDLPFADGAFDFAYCSHLLEHTGDPARAIAELERVARAGYIEVPSEYLEKAAKSTPSHYWFVRLENGTLVFSPKPAGVLDETINRVFDETLMERDALYTAFHWSRFYTLFNIGLRWSGTIPHRVSAYPSARTIDFVKGAEDLSTEERIERLREVITRARERSSARPHPLAWRGVLKRLIRWYYRTGKSFDLLEVLVCPACKGRLEAFESTEQLACPACRKEYPLIAGVPCLVKSAARDLPAHARLAR